MQDNSVTSERMITHTHGRMRQLVSTCRKFRVCLSLCKHWPVVPTAVCPECCPVLLRTPLLAPLVRSTALCALWQRISFFSGYLLPAPVLEEGNTSGLTLFCNPEEVQTRLPTHFFILNKCVQARLPTLAR